MSFGVPLLSYIPKKVRVSGVGDSCVTIFITGSLRKAGNTKKKEIKLERI